MINLHNKFQDYKFTNYEDIKGNAVSRPSAGRRYGEAKVHVVQLQKRYGVAVASFVA